MNVCSIVTPYNLSNGRITPRERGRLINENTGTYITSNVYPSRTAPSVVVKLRAAIIALERGAKRGRSTTARPHIIIT